MGVRPGVHDYHLPIGRGEFNGLWVEMKSPKPHRSRVEPSQLEWSEKMIFSRHAVFVCYGFMQAKRTFEWYLRLPVPDTDPPATPTIEEVMSAERRA